MTILTLDIETIPTSDPEVIAEIAARITHPGNISKQETIDKWNLEQRPAAIEKAVAETSFDGALGSIVCIGWAFDDNEPQYACGLEETFILHNFTSSIEYEDIVSLTVVGHNVTGFDLRFLWQRLIINNIKPPYQIPWNAKSWEDSIGDTMKMWNPAIDKRISLDRLCKVLGVPTSKGDMDGSKVAQYAREGRYEEIAKYCCADVVATRSCYERMI